MLPEPYLLLYVLLYVKPNCVHNAKNSIRIFESRNVQPINLPVFHKNCKLIDYTFHDPRTRDSSTVDTRLKNKLCAMSWTHLIIKF